MCPFGKTSLLGVNFESHRQLMPEKPIGRISLLQEKFSVRTGYLAYDLAAALHCSVWLRAGAE